MRISLFLHQLFLSTLLFVLPSAAALACNQLPVPSISSSGQLTFCEGQTVTLNSSTGIGYTYQWRKDGVNIQNATSSSYVVSQTGSYTVVVTLDTCSKTSLAANVTVNPVPVATLSASDTIICQSESVTLTAGGGVSYAWSASGGVGNTLTISPNSTNTYSVTVTNSFNCTAVKSVTITVRPLPLTNISVAGSSTLCEGQSVNLNASTGTGYGYAWYRNNILVNGATTSTLNVNSSGNYHVITTLNGCSRTSTTTTITVNPRPVPQMTADTTVCATSPLTLQASGGVSYQWSGGGPATADYNIAPTSTNTYTVTVTNSFNCTQTASVVVTVILLPNASISVAGSTTLCDGQSVNLNASLGTGYSYVWYKDNLLINGATNATLNVNAAGDYVVVTTQNGCSRTSAPRNVIVNPRPVPVISSDTTVCATSPLTLQASGGVSYQWSGGGPTTADYNIAPTSTNTYTVTVTNSLNCTQTASVVVTVIPLPNASISVAGSPTLCDGQSVNLNASMGTSYSYVWYKDNSLIPGANNSTLSVNAAGDYHVITTQNGCSRTSAPRSIIVNPRPVPVISPDTTICAGNPVTLDAGGGISYQWSGGGPATAQYVVSPNSTTTYTVTLTNSFGCTQSATTTVSVIPLANFSVSLSSSTTFCADRTLTMTASFNAGFNYQWFKDAGMLSGANTNVLIVNETGIYTVEVSANGCSKLSNPVNVTVNPIPVASTSNDPTICSGDTIQISAFGGTAYTWSNGNTNQTISVFPTNTTTYNVTVTNGFNCTVSESVTVTTIARPTANVTPVNSVSVCNGQAATLTATSGTGYSYQWFQNNGMMNGATNSTFDATVAGSYHVVVTENGCPRKSNNVTVNVHPLPVVTTSNDTTICSGNPVTLTAGGGATYKWSTGPTSQNLTVSPSTNTTYSVTVTTTNNCSATGSVFVSVIPSPAANVTTTGTLNLCQGQSVTFNANTSPLYAYQWRNNGIDINGETNASFTTNSAGSYSVRISALGCSTISTTYTVTVNPLPVAVVSPDTTICQGESVTLEASGGTSYNWSNGRNTPTNTVSPNSTLTYSVTVTNSFSCTNVASVTVNVTPLPNAFISQSGSTNLCTGQTVTLNASQAVNNFYQWLRDSIPLPGADSSRLITGIAGSHQVVITNNGCSRTSNPVNVTVNPVLVAYISNDTSICAGDTVTLAAWGGDFYNWSSGQTTDTIIDVPLTTKTYSVTVSTGGSCSTVKNVTVTVRLLPNAFISVSGGVSSICQGQTATMTANSAAGLSYQWFNHSDSIPGANAQQYIASDSGNYAVLVTLNGCSRMSPPRPIEVNPLPVAVASNDTTICSGSSLTMRVSGGESYVWNTWATDSIYTVTPTSSRTYTVTVSNSFGCKAIDSVKVEVLSLPNSTITVTSSSTICDGKSVRLNAGSTTGIAYQWQLNGTDIDGAKGNFHDATEHGSYILVVTGSNGCSRSSNPFNVTMKPTPATPEILLIEGDSLMSSVEGNSYRWFRDGLTFNVGSRKVKPNKSAAYTVFVTLDGCPSDTSAPYFFYFTDIEPLVNHDVTLSIYPNPSQGNFSIVFPASFSGLVDIELYNTVGQSVWNSQHLINNEKINIVATSLPTGFYFLRATSGTQVLNSRVMIEGK